MLTSSKLTMRGRGNFRAAWPKEWHWLELWSAALREAMFFAILTPSIKHLPKELAKVDRNTE